MKNSIFVLLVLIAFSCTNSADKNVVNAADSTSKNVSTVSSGIELTDQADQNIYNAYIRLKNALVAANLDEAKKASADLKLSLEARKGCESTALIAEKINSAKDVAAQRKEFAALSSDVIALFRHADLNKGSIYVQHCPMANNGNGADWLSSDKKIQNPYYGNEMVDCGAVVEEIKTKK